MRRLMVLLGLLATMMLVASPVLAWQPGPNEGNKYWKNYYPNTYFKYCDKNGAQFYGKTKASKRCAQYYTDYKTKWNNGKKYYYVHVYYWWESPDGQAHKWDDWYYCQYHKYDDPDSTKPYFKTWVTYKPTGNYYWESYYKGPLNF